MSIQRKHIKKQKHQNKKQNSIVYNEEEQVVKDNSLGSSRQMSRKLSTQAQLTGQPQLSDVAKTKIIDQKIEDIRNEFFQTYISNLKDLPPDQLKKARKNVPWHEHMTVTSDRTVQLDQNGYNDDIQREIQFYKITLENTQRAIAYLTQENIPIQRPKDFEVEMFKSPKLQGKIQDRLVRQQVRVKNFEEKKLRNQGKKLQKMIKVKKMRDEHKEKKQNQLAIEEWKKEIKDKGSDKARDLSDFMRKKHSLKNEKKEEGKFSKFSRAKGHTTFKKQDNNSSFGVRRKGLFNKAVKQGKTKRPGKISRDRSRTKRASCNKNTY